MNEELCAFTFTHTLDLGGLLPKKSIISCKWVYNIKTHYDGNIKQYNAILVAKDFTYEYGIDYKDTFALAA